MVAALILIGAVLFILLIFLSAAVKVAREYERGVVFRLGRLLQPPKGPGLFLLIPVVDRMVRVDLRTITLNVPPLRVALSMNAVSMSIGAGKTIVVAFVAPISSSVCR